MLTLANGDREEGQFRNGRLHGRGVVTWAKGDRYEGDFRDGEQTGRGTYTWPDGDRYEGGFRDGKLHGQGVYTWANGKRWSGNFVNDKRGRGTWTQAAGSTGGSGASSTTAGGSGSGETPAAGDTTEAGNAMDCLSIQDKTAGYGYPNFWITNNCQRRVVVHVCGTRLSSLRECKRAAETMSCGKGDRPLSLYDKNDDVPPTPWKDRYYRHFIGLGPNTRIAAVCSEDIHYAACFYGRGNAGESRFYITDSRYVFESDKHGNFRCHWGEQVFGQARGRKHQ